MNKENKRRVNLLFFKASGKYYTEEEREYPRNLAVFEIVEEIENHENLYPGMHIVLNFEEHDEIGYPCMILLNQRKANKTETADEWIMTDEDSFQIQRCVRDVKETNNPAPDKSSGVRE